MICLHIVLICDRLVLQFYPWCTERSQCTTTPPLEYKKLYIHNSWEFWYDVLNHQIGFTQVFLHCIIEREKTPIYWKGFPG